MWKPQPLLIKIPADCRMLKKSFICRNPAYCSDISSWDGLVIPFPKNLTIKPDDWWCFLLHGIGYKVCLMDSRSWILICDQKWWILACGIHFNLLISLFDKLLPMFLMQYFRLKVNHQSNLNKNSHHTKRKVPDDNKNNKHLILSLHTSIRFKSRDK